MAPIALYLYASEALAQCHAINTHKTVDNSSVEINQPYKRSAEILLSKQVMQNQRATAPMLYKQRVEKRIAAPEMSLAVQSSVPNHDSVFSDELEELEGSNEKYQFINPHRFIDVSKQPVSTFSVDVDTASYANVRRYINQGSLPPKDAVRTEEMINYFDDNYLKSNTAQTPISVDYELTQTPWNAQSKLLKVELQANDAEIKSGSNIVFLIDVSGSMASANKLPLLKKSLSMFTKQLTAQDCVSIVTYAGSANMVLNATSGNQQFKIMQVINQLRAGGSTNGSDGLALAYELAAVNYRKDAVNRVLLATDGDFNLGMSDPSNMETYIAKLSKTGVNLSVLGFGQGNYNDHLMESLSNAGNGNAAYIDSLQEANKVLIQQMRANFVTVAYGTKVQLEFNPSVVSSYRLLGYENRALTKREFIDDKKDAGDMGSGQSVTAIYELYYAANDEANAVRYQNTAKHVDIRPAELGFIKLRYKKQFDSPSQQIEKPILLKSNLSLAQTSSSFKLAIAATAFAEKLRDSSHLLNYSWDSVIQLASRANTKDECGYRNQFIQRVRLVKTL